jgi:hypothetical protein
VSFCWKCREKLPTRTFATARRGTITRGIGQAAVALLLFGVMATTFWWALVAMALASLVTAMEIWAYSDRSLVEVIDHTIAAIHRSMMA